MLYSEHISVSSDSGKPALIFRDKNGNNLSATGALNKASNRFYNYFLDFELFFLRLISSFPIHFIRILFYKLSGVKVGTGTHFHMGTQFFNPSGVEIGKGTIIGQNVFLDGRDKLKIGDNVDIASDVLIYNSEHDIDSSEFEAIKGPVEIDDYVFIGPRSIILPGVSIGKGAVIAAGAVVVKNVQEFEVVGGVPAKVIGERKLKDPKYKLGRTRLFQ